MRVPYLIKFEVTLFVLIITMIVFPVALEFLDGNTAWIVSNCLIVMIGLTIGLLTSFTSGISGLLGPEFVGSMMQGLSASFILVSLVRLLCLLVFPGQDSWNQLKGTILYFILNVIILTAMAISIPFFLRSDFVINQFRRDSKTIDDLLMTESSHRTKVNGKVVFKKIWVEAIVISATFGITFMMYPSIVY